MQVTLNPSQVARLVRFVVWWALYVVFCLVVGPAARPDEVLFVIALPVPIIAVYAAFCLAAAYIRVMLIMGGVAVQPSAAVDMTAPQPRWGRSRAPLAAPDMGAQRF
jgi:hypothetical protein